MTHARVLCVLSVRENNTKTTQKAAKIVCVLISGYVESTSWCRFTDRGGHKLLRYPGTGTKHVPHFQHE